MAVQARLNGAARDSTHEKKFSTISDFIQHLKQRFAPHKTYSWHLHEISTIRMSHSESVSEFYDRITLLKSGAQAALEDKYQNAEQMLLFLNDCALEAFIRGLLDVISGMVESRNPSSLESALKYALEYEARHQLNPHFPMNNIAENRYSTPYVGSRDKSPSPHVRFASSPDRNRAMEPRQGPTGIIRRPTIPIVPNYPNNYAPPFQYPPYLPYQPYPYYPGSLASNNPYPNHNYPYKGTNTTPRAQSPAPANKNDLNFDSARRTDATTSVEKTERQTSVRFLKKQEKSSVPNSVENPQ